MPIPDTIAKGWNDSGKGRREQSDLEKIGKDLVRAIEGNNQAIQTAIQNMPAPCVTVEAAKTEMMTPCAYRSTVTKRDAEGRILEITHEPIMEK